MITRQEAENRIVNLGIGDAVWRYGPDAWYMVFYPYTMGDAAYRHVGVSRCWYCKGSGCDGCGSLGLEFYEMEEGRPPRGSLY